LIRNKCMANKSFTKAQIRKIQLQPIAEKYGKTKRYVRMILLGERKHTTKVQQEIFKEGAKLIEFIERNI